MCSSCYSDDNIARTVNCMFVKDLDFDNDPR